MTLLLPPQDEVQTALESFFRVGESGGKTPDRFDELMKVKLAAALMSRLPLPFCHDWGMAAHPVAAC